MFKSSLAKAVACVVCACSFLFNNSFAAKDNVTFFYDDLLVQYANQHDAEFDMPPTLLPAAAVKFSSPMLHGIALIHTEEKDQCELHLLIDHKDDFWFADNNYGDYEDYAKTIASLAELTHSDAFDNQFTRQYHADFANKVWWSATGSTDLKDAKKIILRRFIRNAFVGITHLEFIEHCEYFSAHDKTEPLLLIANKDAAHKKPYQIALPMSLLMQKK